MRAIKLTLTLLLATVMVVASGGPSSADGDCTYEVQSGDTLIEIALKLGVTLPDLIQVNNIKNPNNIWKGQQLIIPDCPKTIQPTTFQRAHTDPLHLVKAVRPGGIYNVTRTDTVCSLATEWGVPVEKIIEENELPEDGELYWGQALKRPAPPPKVVASTGKPPIFIHEYGTFPKVLPETVPQLLTLIKPTGLPAVCAWIALQGGSSNPDILREQKIKDIKENWDPPQHLTEDHTDKDALRRLITWDYLMRWWRLDMKPPDHCVCNVDKTKCAVCWDDVLIPSATTPGKYYKGGCLILKYAAGSGPSTAIPDIQILEKTSWFDLDQSPDPFVMSPIDKCPPWTFQPNYNRRKTD